MRQMSTLRSRSDLTLLQVGHLAIARPRLQFEFTSSGRTRSPERAALEIHQLEGATRSRKSDVGDAPDAPAELSSFYIAVFLKSVSAAVAAAGAPVPADLATGDIDSKSFESRLSDAFDIDLASSLGEAKNTPSGSAKLIRLLKSWTKKSDSSRRLLIGHVLEAARDPLIWYTAHEDVGPRPKVNVRLVMPGSYANATTVDPLEDVDIAIVYRGTARAGEEVEELAEAMTPDIDIPTPSVVLQARRNAEARAAMLEEFGALTAAEVAELAGSEAKNTSALAGRWRREGRLLGVEHHGTVYYPGFQFDSSGGPRPEIAEVLRYLSPPDVTPWQQALWFTSSNGWLAGRRPVDLLDSDSAAVVAAAEAALREPVG